MVRNSGLVDDSLQSLSTAFPANSFRRFMQHNTRGHSVAVESHALRSTEHSQSTGIVGSHFRESSSDSGTTLVDTFCLKLHGRFAERLHKHRRHGPTLGPSFCRSPGYGTHSCGKHPATSSHSRDSPNTGAGQRADSGSSGVCGHLRSLLTEDIGNVFHAGGKVLDILVSIHLGFEMNICRLLQVSFGSRTTLLRHRIHPGHITKHFDGFPSHGP